MKMFSYRLNGFARTRA